MEKQCLSFIPVAYEQENWIYETQYNGSALDCDEDNFDRTSTPSATSNSQFPSPSRMPALPGTSPAPQAPSQPPQQGYPNTLRVPQPSQHLAPITLIANSKWKGQETFACPGSWLYDHKGPDPFLDVTSSVGVPQTQHIRPASNGLRSDQATFGAPINISNHDGEL
ncbi:hypothetical protein BDN72DRAFT_864414 [Pluteus cervinus]|uniref:Uncharacterized protein n=1 Tax=Pluteus cervinus TaxID=181527 RepID=A0ACD3A449_9AGAR|nr:hypothetical protein BDN72DRAFT_864414 [Pluteus cervinus]